MARANTIHPGNVDFLGLNFDNFDHKQALAATRQLAEQDRFSYVVTPNVDHVVQLNQQNDPDLSAAYRNAGYTLCDSRILASLARFSGLKLQPVPGSDLTRDLLQDLDAGLRLAVIGGDPTLHANMKLLYPQFEWIFHQPPMGLRSNPSRASGNRRICRRCVCNDHLFCYWCAAKRNHLSRNRRAWPR